MTCDIPYSQTAGRSLHRCCRLEALHVWRGFSLQIRSHQASSTAQWICVQYSCLHIDITLCNLIIFNLLCHFYVVFITDVCPFPCSQTPLDQACSNRASKQIKPRKRRVAASHQKSTVVCKKQKRRWATKIPKTKEKKDTYLRHKLWVGKESKPRPLLQRRPAYPGECGISQSLSGRHG